MKLSKGLSLLVVLGIAIILYGCNFSEDNNLEGTNNLVSVNSEDISDEAPNIGSNELENNEVLLLEDISSRLKFKNLGDGDYSQDMIEKSNFVLMISNQSFYNSEVGIEGFINGQVIFEDRFKVDDQHLVSYYYLLLEEGEYNLSFESDSKAILSDVIVVDEGKLWVYLTYWESDDIDPRMEIFINNGPIYID